MLKNKYLRCSPDITFEVFKKIWDKLVATGWRPFVTSTSAKDMYEKWSKDCILTYGPSYSPNTFGIYNEDATLSDDKEVFVGDLIQSSQKSFTLPSRWYVSLNEVSRETLERYVKHKFRTIKGYIYVGGNWSAGIHEGYTEISLEQFTEHVVKEKVTEKETFCVQGDGSSWFGKMILDYLKDKGGRETHPWEYATTGYFNIDDNSDINWLGDSPVGRVISKDEVIEHFCYKGAIKGGKGRHGKAVISHLKEKGATKNTDWTGCDSLFYYIVVKDGAYALEQGAWIPEGYHEVVLKKEVPSIYMGGIKGDGDRYYGKKVIQFLVKAGGKNLSGYMGSSVDKSVDKYYFINKEGVIEWSFSLPEDYTEVPRTEVEDAYVEEIEPVKDAPVPLVETYAEASLEPVIENITNIYFPKVEEIL